MKTISIKSIIILIAIITINNNMFAQTAVPVHSHFTDERDGRIINTVEIGNQWWMSQNLMFQPSVGNYWVYDNERLTTTYGYLYDWKTANKVCPDGWHLPSDEDWEILIDYLGGDEEAGAKLKVRGSSHWEYGNNGNNESGFSAYPGGFRGGHSVTNHNPPMDAFHFKHVRTYFWSSTETNWHSNLKPNANYVGLHSGFKSMYSHSTSLNKDYGLSVRCVKNSKYKSKPKANTKKAYTPQKNNTIEDEVFNFAVIEDKPEFPGGQKALLTYLAKNTKYPEIAKNNGKKGTVFVQFVINKDGTVADVKPARKVDPYLDKEAVRVVKNMPRWKSGKQRGKAVRVQYIVPIKFILHKKK